MSESILGASLWWARRLGIAAIAVGMIALASVECSAAEKQADNTGDATNAEDDPKPCLTDEPEEPGEEGPCITGEPDEPEFRQERRMWASSYLWAKAPKLVVQEWLTEKPDLRGKYVLIEFWATWCPPCRRSLALLNGFHEKYGEELVVIGISHESAEDVLALNDKHPESEKIEFYSAIDTKARTKKKLGVWGIPHVILLEPEGYVIWEGFPLLKDYELTDEIIGRALAVGRKLKAEAAAKEGDEKE